MVDEVELDYDDDDVVDYDGTSHEGEAESTDKPRNARQPKKVNLDELDEFRAWKSKSDQRVAQAERAAAQAAQRAQELERQFHEARMGSMDDADRIAYERDMLKRQIAEIEQQRAYDFQLFQWNQSLKEISEETGIDIEQLEEAKDIHDAWRMGRKFEKSQGGKTRKTSRYDELDEDEEEDEPRRPVDNRVALGDGKPQGKAGRIQVEYNKALEQYDYDGMLAAEEKAIRAGISLNHMR